MSDLQLLFEKETDLPSTETVYSETGIRLFYSDEYVEWLEQKIEK